MERGSLRTRRPRARGALTWRALGPQRGWSMPAAGGCWAPWWCPCPAPQPGTEGTGLPHPAPQVWRPREGLSIPGTLAASLSLFEPSLPRHRHVRSRPDGAWVLAPLLGCGAPTLSLINAIPLRGSAPSSASPARPPPSPQGIRVLMEPFLGLVTSRLQPPHRAHPSLLSSPCA